MSLWMLWQRIHFRDQPPGQNAITQKPPLTSLERVLRGLVIMMPFMFIHIPFMYCDIYIYCIYTVYIYIYPIYIHIYYTYISIYTYIYTYIQYVYIYIYISYVYINRHALRISPYFFSYVHLCAVHGAFPELPQVQVAAVPHISGIPELPKAGNLRHGKTYRFI